MVSRSAARFLGVWTALCMLYAHVMHGLFGWDVLTTQAALFAFICVAVLAAEWRDRRSAPSHGKQG